MQSATSGTFTEHFDRVQVHTDKDGYIVVEPIWRGVDRPNVGGWSAGRNAQLAARLKRAIESGAAFGRVQVRTDANGRTYIDTMALVFGRHMNADLKRLGY
jgi:hypothetical protein